MQQLVTLVSCAVHKSISLHLCYYILHHSSINFLLHIYQHLSSVSLFLTAPLTISLIHPSHAPYCLISQTYSLGYYSPQPPLVFTHLNYLYSPLFHGLLPLRYYISIVTLPSLLNSHFSLPTLFICKLRIHHSILLSFIFVVINMLMRSIFMAYSSNQYIFLNLSPRLLTYIKKIVSLLLKKLEPNFFFL